MKQYIKMIMFFLTIYYLAVSYVLAETISIDGKKFNESYTENINISGSVRIGVMYESLLNKVSFEYLFIDVVQNSGKMLCVKIQSIDGKYSADFELPVEKEWNGITHFTLPSRYNDKITEYSPSHLAIFAEIKSDCMRKTNKIVPASWGPPRTETVKIFLNSGQFQSHLKIYRNNGEKEKIFCQSIKAGNNTAYDTECIITKAIAFNLLKTTIIRRNNNNFSKPIKLPIARSRSKL